jgi:hypothetical protein
MRILFSAAIILFQAFALSGQSLSGMWEGALSQEGKAADFVYRLEIRQDGAAVSGASYSASPDGKAYARFTVTGIVQDNQIIIQEIEQFEPAEPRWCLKYMTLQLTENGADRSLAGAWKASGCTPGKISLKFVGGPGPTIVEKELPFEFAGQWTGHLSQSDRDYGFYFEMNLEERPNGTSYIVSEENGGAATHILNWSLDKPLQRIAFTESEIREKTNPRWRWCIKTGTLDFRREQHRYVLEGKWSGHIEGYTQQTGPCASGKIYLEKPILTQTEQIPGKEFPSYEGPNQRKVKVARVLEVKNKNIRIRVWDNGVVDGDVLTLFLNGEQILRNYRVSKTKRSIPVQLKEENNILILHADDLGDIPPNTVAVSVDDGESEQVIILSSNLKESGAVLIKQFRID